MGTNRRHTDDLATILIEHCLVGVAVVKEDGHFESANPAFCELTEYTESELQSRTFQEITHPDDVRDDTEMTKRLRLGERDVFEMKKRYITKTNRIVWVVLRVIAIREADGRFKMFLSQASQILEISPPRVPSTYPATPLPSLKFHIWKSIKENWPQITAVTGAIALIIAQIIEKLSTKLPPTPPTLPPH